MKNIDFLNRTIYRELFNDLCADYSIYRLTGKIDDEFIFIENKLWTYREKSLYMTNEDKEDFDDFLIIGKSYLIKKKVFKS